ncbi:EthD domain-containing protein [Nocardia sp. CA-135398]|uniref:EthD domain-containing protein n=1 Tax=Nocardia sp. CA-135398 TaxID=3239977 RepID=UPI003D99CB73
MVKLVLIVKKHAEMSLEEFNSHWRTEHAQLVQKFGETLRIERYVQSIRIPSPGVDHLRAERGWTGEAEASGVAELYWDSEEDMLAGMSSPAGQAAMADLACAKLGEVLEVFMTTENVVIGR